MNNYFQSIEDLKKEADEKFATQLNASIEKVSDFLNQLKSNTPTPVD